jgi:hypothetical protein
MDTKQNLRIRLHFAEKRVAELESDAVILRNTITGLHNALQFVCDIRQQWQQCVLTSVAADAERRETLDDDATRAAEPVS